MACCKTTTIKCKTSLIKYFATSLTSPDWEPSGLGTWSPDPGGRAAGFKYWRKTRHFCLSLLLWGYSTFPLEIPLRQKNVTAHQAGEICSVRTLPIFLVPFLHPWKLQPWQISKCSLPPQFALAFLFCSLSKTLNHKPYKNIMLYTLWLWNCCSESWGGLNQNFGFCLQDFPSNPPLVPQLQQGLCWFGLQLVCALLLHSLPWAGIPLELQSK